eukprot:scaffold517014_cov63-Attheya_sp.AAC.1
MSLFSVHSSKVDYKFVRNFWITHHCNIFRSVRRLVAKLAFLFNLTRVSAGRANKPDRAGTSDQGSTCHSLDH